MTMPIEAESHPFDGLIRTERLPHIWCPGCGIGKVIQAYAKMAKKYAKDNNFPVTNHTVVSGIGCTGRAAGYVDLDSYHSTHGRAIPFATGMKLANQDLQVTVISGDGDLSTIGGNHIIHAARRNIDINVIMVNNFNYGMTGGQFSATTPHNAVTATSPKGNIEEPFQMPYLMKAAGASFVARWTTLHVQQLEKSIYNAFVNPGFSFVEVLSPCPKGFGKRNKLRKGIDAMRYFEGHSVKADEIQIELTYADMLKDEDIPLGEFVRDKRQSYLEIKNNLMEARQ